MTSGMLVLMLTLELMPMLLFWGFGSKLSGS